MTQHSAEGPIKEHPQMVTRVSKGKRGGRKKGTRQKGKIANQQNTFNKGDCRPGKRNEQKGDREKQKQKDINRGAKSDARHGYDLRVEGEGKTPCWRWKNLKVEITKRNTG